MFTLNDLLDIAIKMETNGEAIYRQAAARVKNEKLRTLMEWMADEENRHRQWFQNQKQAWKKDLGKTEPNGIPGGILHEMMGDKGLSLDDVDLTTLTTPAELLEAFIEFETDSLLFYDFMEAFVHENAKEGLQRIQAEEKKHVAALRNMLAAL